MTAAKVAISIIVTQLEHITSSLLYFIEVHAAVPVKGPYELSVYELRKVSSLIDNKQTLIVKRLSCRSREVTTILNRDEMSISSDTCGGTIL